MIKCIAIDMDGTLLTATQQITDENIAAIRKAQSQGVEVVIATGRSFKEARFVLDRAGLICPVICINGAEIRSVNNEIIAANSLEKTIAKQAASILSERNVYYEVYTNQGTYTLDEDKAISIIADIVLSANPEADIDQIMKVAKIRLSKGLIQKVDNYDVIFNHEEHQIYKLLAFSFEQDLLSSAKEALLKLGQLAVSASGNENLELTSLDAQKGIALEAFVNEKGITLQETMAIGDNYNDLSMFKMAGRAVAMGNADEVIKAQCDAVTLTNEESGVAKAILEVLA
ncbi:HAD family phosphatase [Bacillus sp. FJAT-49705]|uniref:HAD family phosphatase n=1 Tax=Cytobacillus citreus TaxID=2833586 RepID=A0ABS5NQC2_9BACI|nr:Cof-type HAD-IIB family hydrolase [Cytobacillus citreus]MBS4190003.1 HAD family phosphatase [Cytobacillus citreus]